MFWKDTVRVTDVKQEVKTKQNKQTNIQLLEKLMQPNGKMCPGLKLESWKKIRRNQSRRLPLIAFV